MRRLFSCNVSNPSNRKFSDGGCAKCDHNTAVLVYTSTGTCNKTTVVLHAIFRQGYHHEWNLQSVCHEAMTGLEREGGIFAFAANSEGIKLNSVALLTSTAS